MSIGRTSGLRRVTKEEAKLFKPKRRKGYAVHSAWWANYCSQVNRKLRRNAKEELRGRNDY